MKTSGLEGAASSLAMKTKAGKRLGLSPVDVVFGSHPDTQNT